MANKTQRIDERYQIRRGPDGTLLVSLDGVKWLTPSQAGVATEAYADEGDADTLALSQEYADTKAQETREYTDDQVELAKEEARNYTDDQLVDLSAYIEDELALKADLVNGRVPASQLPTFADTLEAFPVLADFPAAGESNVLYVAEDTNYAYRWSGSGYTRVGETLVLGETLDTAYRGDRGKVAYDHTLLTDNPHQVNKTQVGLSNVDNTSNATERAAAATLTNKRINPRVSSAASASSLTPTIANFDQYVYTALAANLTINAPTGTPVVGNKLMFTIKDDGTSRTLTWNAAFAPVGVTLPTATTAGKWTYVGCIYNASATRWDVIAVTTEA